MHDDDLNETCIATMNIMQNQLLKSITQIFNYISPFNVEKKSAGFLLNEHNTKHNVSMDLHTDPI